MEAVRGGTCFAEAWEAFAVLSGVAFAAALATFGVTGLAAGWRGEAVLEAEGIDREPSGRGLKTVTFLSEPIFLGAVLWVCVEAGCGLLEGIP